MSLKRILGGGALVILGGATAFGGLLFSGMGTTLGLDPTHLYDRAGVNPILGFIGIGLGVLVLLAGITTVFSSSRKKSQRERMRDLRSYDALTDADGLDRNDE